MDLVLDHLGRIYMIDDLVIDYISMCIKPVQIYTVRPLQILYIFSVYWEKNVQLMHTAQESFFRHNFSRSKPL